MPAKNILSNVKSTVLKDKQKIGGVHESHVAHSEVLDLADDCAGNLSGQTNEVTHHKKACPAFTPGTRPGLLCLSTLWRHYTLQKAKDLLVRPLTYTNCRYQLIVAQVQSFKSVFVSTIARNDVFESDCTKLQLY